MANRKSLPSTTLLAAEPAWQGLSPGEQVRAAKAALAWARSEMDAGRAEEWNQIAEKAVAVGTSSVRGTIRPAINASGVMLHTGLGRARLAASAAEQILAVAQGHVAIEFDLETGERGDRQEHVRGLLQELTGAESALVVNNCADAVHLCLAALVAPAEVVLSRGQMVEIGGSFRMPEIVRVSGCRMVEVGCTNKTRLGDYETALGPETKAILRCHPSNFRVVGFTQEPSARELAGLARSKGQILIDDVGHGCLVDTTRYGLPVERTIREAVSDGADLVLFSGDKLLGGPQAGMVVGRQELISRIAKHPLARSYRIDKLNLAGLEATLRLYAAGRENEIPLWRDLGRSLAELEAVARQWAAAWGEGATVSEGETEIGGGTFPGVGVPTWRVGLGGARPDAVSAAFRLNEPAVVGRIEDGVFWLDPRAVTMEEAATVREAISRVRASVG